MSGRERPAEVSVEILDVERSPVEGAGIPTALAAVVALLVGAGLWLSGPDPRPPDATAQSPPTSPPQPDQSSGFAASDLLATGTADGLLVLSVETGEMKSIPLAARPVQLARGHGQSVLVHDETSDLISVDLVDDTRRLVASEVAWFAPSTTVGRYWMRSELTPDVIIEVDLDGVIHDAVERFDDPQIDPRVPADAGERQALAVSNSSVFAESCDGRRCHLERRDLDRVGEWEEIQPRPRSTEGFRVSPDGSWAIAGGQVLGLYRTDRGGISMVHTGSSTLVSPVTAHGCSWSARRPWRSSS